jgi:hypothetical protein
MCTTIDIETLVKWFTDRKLLTPNPLAVKMYSTCCLSLTKDELRYGCVQVDQKKMLKAPHPIAFKALCLREWRPASHEEGKAHLAAMRKAVAEPRRA